jgi:hypothetical protein
MRVSSVLSGRFPSQALELIADDLNRPPDASTELETDNNRKYPHGQLPSGDEGADHIT